MPETAIPTPGSDQQEKPQTARPEQNPTPASREAPKHKVAAPRKEKAWKRLGYASAVIGTLSLAVGLSVYDRLRTAGDGLNRGRKPDAPLHGPHPDVKHHGKNALAGDKARGLRLVNYRSEAEEALILASFYEDEGATDKLRKCLEALKRWKQEEIEVHGEPRFRDVDGLVISRTHEDTIEKDFWERVTSAIRRLSHQLNEPLVSGTGITPASNGKR
jgi:hypothetical protein